MRAILAVAVFALCFTALSAEASRGPASMDKKTAKEECLKEKPDLKGKALRKCVKEKTK